MRTDSVSQTSARPLSDLQMITKSGADDEERRLKRACADFEGMFLGYLLKSMRKTVTTTDLFGSKREEEFFRDLMDAEICSTAARTQSVGIAEMLYRQLARTNSSSRIDDTAASDKK
ncbi:MAG: rod-binding protein [Armatimonadetes bacterium]|nr:rod-binding protein [Armatimonadota bacterium]